jgi:branched-chain amino acid aminotransferase
LLFTGTAVGIAPIVRVDHRAIRDGVIGPITRGIQQLYTDAAHGRLPHYMEWLTAVYASQPQTAADFALAGTAN